MKKLIMLFIVIVVTVPVSADLIVRYDFDDDLTDSSGNGYDATCGTGVSFGYRTAVFDGTANAWVQIPLGAANPCGGDQNFTIAMAYSCTNTAEGQESGNTVLFSTYPNPGGDFDGTLGIQTNNDAQQKDVYGENLDLGDQSGIGFADGELHWFILTYRASTETRSWYGIDDEGSVVPISSSNPTWGYPTWEYPVNYSIAITKIGNGPDDWVDEMTFIPLEGEVDAFALYDHILTEEEMADLPGDAGPMYPLAVDPNTMLVYETGETMGDFNVSLKFPPVGQGPANQGTPYTITVVIDPNGGFGEWGASAEGEKDIQLLAGQGADNQITLTFDNTNWNQPQTILFKALDDTVAEPPELIEINNIGLTITSTVAEPNLNGPEAGVPWTKSVATQVMDNDQADILFTYTPPEQNTPKYPVTGPVQIWEQPRWFYGNPYDRWRKIGITLQVPPLVGADPCQPTSVKLQAVVEGEIEGDNLPLTDPCLPFEETDDPNGIIFTASNYNLTQSIKIWANDDTVLQVMGEEGDYPAAAGDEDYQATLVVTVIDNGGDTRYTDLERTVTLDIEDNECGAYGILPMDIGNPNAFTDPNYRDSDGNPLPDCYVDIYDLIEFAGKWLDCSYLQDPACESYL